MKVSRSTTAKSAIIELFSHSTNALTHTDIKNSLGDLCNRVTIYRVLDRLIAEGIVHKVMDTDGIAKFLACQNCEDNHHHHHHLHFSCNSCGNVTCLHHVVPQFELPKNYQIEAMNFTVSGICPNCK